MRSYDPEPTSGGFATEILRLRTQVELSWEVERRRLAAIGVSNGHRLLELGCGPGFVTRRLADWLPHSSIVALDTDPQMLAIARETLAEYRECHRVALLQASIVATGLASDTFDVAISRYLFQHLPDPVAAAAEVRRVLRPGGIHVVTEIDDGLWGLSEPEYPEFRAWHHRRAQAQASRGGNRFLGRRLGRILREAGYTGVELDVFGYDSDELGIGAFAPQLSPHHLLPLVDEGLLTIEEYLRACALYQDFTRSPSAFVLLVGFIARAEKPR